MLAGRRPWFLINKCRRDSLEWIYESVNLYGGEHSGFGGEFVTAGLSVAESVPLPPLVARAVIRQQLLDGRKSRFNCPHSTRGDPFAPVLGCRWAGGSARTTTVSDAVRSGDVNDHSGLAEAWSAADLVGGQLGYADGQLAYAGGQFGYAGGQFGWVGGWRGV